MVDPGSDGLLPVFSIGACIIPLCTQYVYLGAPVRIPRATPAQRVHPVIRGLLDRLQKRFAPLKSLATKADDLPWDLPHHTRHPAWWSYSYQNCVFSILRLNVTVPEEVFVPGPPPWLAPVPVVHYTPTSKAALPVLQRQLALEAIEAASSSVPVSHRVYTDGSLHDTVGGMAKAACGLPPNGNGPSPSLLCYRARLRSDALLSTARSRDTQRGDSVSIQHYDVIRAHSYKYRHRGLIVRWHNVVSARLRLGYRPVWQVAGMAEEPNFTSCQLCDAPSSNTLAHYCLHCHVVRDMLPRVLPLTEICRFLLVHDNLDTILVRHPRFGGC
ncbi:hypothetical protein GWK47_052363 [Chionoecetes opilio]|uniref:Uncharacterized protein n=1 Tax=Chionoecetes opilio TaxID=41210 RepID=A0A8J4Y1R3_CHIOP|nr:hypothetical protein GWK47_052363 [Chionoecetes opilio]